MLCCYTKLVRRNIFASLIMSMTLLIASISVFAGSRDDYMKERLAKQKRVEQVQMMDLGIDFAPKVDRNAMGAISHHAERSAEKQFTIYSYPKFYFGNDGRLELADVNIRPSKEEGIAYEMDNAVYRFYAYSDGSYWIFHYGMWMHFYISDIAYMDSSTGTLHSLGWEHFASEATVEKRKIEWLEIFPGVGLEIELSEDFVKESILLTEEARANLPDPSVFGLSPKNTDIVMVYDVIIDELCNNYKFPDYDLSESYEISDASGLRAKSDDYAIQGELAFSRKGVVRHKFLRDEALLPGYIDRDQTPELRTEVIKYWQNTEDGETFLAYGIPYAIHENADPGTIIIDPTIKFQEGVYSYSGSDMTQIRDTAGSDYNYGRDAMLKVSDYSGGTKWRSLVKFDLSDISHITANNIVSASVNLKFRSYIGTLTSRDASAYQIKRDWNEGSSAQGETPDSGEATWNEAKYSEDDWGTAGCDNTSSDRNSSADDTTSLTTTVGNWNEWDITDSVQSWLGSSLSNNYGVLIRPDWTSGYPEFAHYSDDEATASYRPQLVVYVNVPSQPWHDDDMEFLGDDSTLNDGIVFKENGSPTTTFESNDTIFIEWTLTTNQSYDAYGCGQFLRMWLDINADGIYSSTEEMTLTDTNDLSNPYVIESHKNGMCVNGPCESGGIESATYTLPDTDAVIDNTITYKFTIPTINPVGSVETTARILLRFQEWPNDDPTEDYSVDDTPNNCDSMEPIYGDVEDHSVTLIQ